MTRIDLEDDVHEKEELANGYIVCILYMQI